MKDLYKYSLFFLCLSIIIGEEFLLKQFGIPSQALLAAPIMMASFLSFRRPSSDLLWSGFLLAGFIFTYLLIISSFQGFISVYRVFGNTLLGIAIANPSFRKISIEYGLRYMFWLGSILLVLTFYIGVLWKEKGGGTLSAYEHNASNLAEILTFSFAVGMLLTSKCQQWNLKLLFAALTILHIPPVLATVSRSGIFSSMLVVIVFAGAYFGRQFFAMFAVIAVFILGLGIQLNIDQLGAVGDRLREVEEDPRIRLVSAAYSTFEENMLYGVGLDNFNSNRWRINQGISSLNRVSQKHEAVSVHNSFLDLGLIGGLPLMLVYMLIILYPLVVSLRYFFSLSREQRLLSALIISFTLTVVVYAFFHHAIVNKHNWLIIGLNYLLVSYLQQDSITSSEANPDNRTRQIGN